MPSALTLAGSSVASEPRQRSSSAGRSFVQMATVMESAPQAVSSAGDGKLRSYRFDAETLRRGVVDERGDVDASDLRVTAHRQQHEPDRALPVTQRDRRSVQFGTDLDGFLRGHVARHHAIPHVASTSVSWAWVACIRVSSANRPSRSSSSSRVPCSSTRPLSSTTMRSALAMVDRRCAITIIVQRRRNASSACCTSRSEMLSRALVASSRMRISGSRTMARASASRCSSPPDSLTPPSPSRVS